MKLSTRSRYGTRFMLDLALNQSNGPVLLKEISKRQEISEKYLSQLVIPLKSRGLINASRGAHGGYRLARTMQEITLKDIVEVMEGDLNLVECVNNPAVCSRVKNCSSRCVWSELGSKISHTLAAVTLRDLVSRHKEESTGEYQI